MAVSELRVEDLVSLFWGDDSSCGFQHSNLVLEACRRIQPTSLAMLRARFLPPVGELTSDDFFFIEEGWHRWRAELSMTRRKQRTALPR